MTTTLKLGLIGDNIVQSQSPHLHETAGRLSGVEVSYERLIPRDLGLTFEETFAKARGDGYRGINVTYPYKERVTEHVTVKDPSIRAIGSVNTVIFSEEGPLGFNTDYSGFIKAYRAVRGDAAPGTVCMIGAGGVGKAVGFGLVGLGAKAIRCVDLDLAKAQALADALIAAGTDTQITVSDNPVASAQGADGLVNCTPLGMANIGGSALPAEAMTKATWAFDAVYTPVETQFLQDAQRAGLTVISGYELFFGQGVDAWALFSGAEINHAALRRALQGDAT